MKNIKRKAGFTLIEMIIYIAMVSVIMTAMVGILLSTFKTNNSITRQQQLQNVKLFLNEHIQSSFQASHTIINPANTTQSAEITLGTVLVGTSTFSQYFDYQYDPVLKAIYFYTGSIPTPFPLTLTSVTTGGGVPIDVYFYRIAGLDNVGNTIAVSNQLTVPVSSSGSIVNLSWSNSNPLITSYRIYRFSQSNATLTGPASTTALTTYSDTTASYPTITLNFPTGSSTTNSFSTCSITNCKLLTSTDYVKINNFQTFLIKDSTGQNSAIRIHIELQSPLDPNTKTNLDTQYTL